MISPNDAREAGDVPTKKPRRSGQVILLLILAAVAVGVPGYLLWNRTRRAEQDVARLSRQAEELRKQVEQARAQSDAALGRASQAQVSAAKAAQERDQAFEARAQSERVAAEAQRQTVVAAAEATQAQQEATKLRAQHEAELDRLQSVLGEIASTRKTALGLVVTLGSDSIRFDFDKSTLRENNREVLSRIAGVLMTLQGYHIYVYGYTDDVGTAQYNQKLSERRAAAVCGYLVKSGLDPTIISARGYGQADPLEKGESAQARAKNRRVEIGIVDSLLQMEGEVPPASASPHN